MKDDENLKEAREGQAAEPAEEARQLDRSEFLKTVGVGAAAAGLGILAGDQSLSSAATEPNVTRSAVQKLMRGLLESPSQAKDFLDSPQSVAREFGVYLSDEDARTIQETLKKLSTQIALREGHDQWGPSGHNNWYSKVVKPIAPSEGGASSGERKPTMPKPPSGGKRK